MHCEIDDTYTLGVNCFYNNGPHILIIADNQVVPNG